METPIHSLAHVSPDKQQPYLTELLTARYDLVTKFYPKAEGRNGVQLPESVLKGKGHSLLCSPFFLLTGMQMGWLDTSPTMNLC